MNLKVLYDSEGVKFQLKNTEILNKFRLENLNTRKLKFRFECKKITIVLFLCNGKIKNKGN